MKVSKTSTADDLFDNLAKLEPFLKKTIALLLKTN